MDLLERSIKIIEENQSKAGSYVASPNFSQYGYCWFRDGSFTAHAMQKAGKKESAEKFIRWGLNVLKRYRHSLEDATFGSRSDLSILLPTRYTLDGFISEDDWTNAQSDGYGTFLWIVAENSQLLDESDLEICDLCAKYLEGVWEIPCYDVWEEFPTMIHTSTLLSIVAGLKSIEGAINRQTEWKKILDFILKELTYDGRLKKSTALDSVDSSLIWASYPFRLFDSDTVLMRRTEKTIIDDLYCDGGLKRYNRDTYYGGGSWILLSAYLAGHLKLNGENTVSEEIKKWIEKNVDNSGSLPEQIPEHLIDTKMYEPWVKKWGDIASPLLWSHAAYIDMIL